MDVRAAVAFEAGKPLEVTQVKLDGPKAGEVLVELKATGICHTDEFRPDDHTHNAALGHQQGV
jgi:S-(hydroxymethyl)glutathione dehydrogenase/alcohol dehydrogenase